MTTIERMSRGLGTALVSSGVLTRLRSDIIDGRLSPGQKLPFAELQKTYGAGIGTLREALSHLLAEGFVQLDVGRGFRVTQVSRKDLLDISTLRVDFEKQALADSMRHGDTAWELRVMSSHHLLSEIEQVSLEERLRDPTEWTDRHRNFHLALVSACRSHWLLNFHAVLFDQAHRYRMLALRHAKKTVQNASQKTSGRSNEHKEIMQATLARDGAVALKLAEDHIRYTVDDVLRFAPQLAEEA